MSTENIIMQAFAKKFPAGLPKCVICQDKKRIFQIGFYIIPLPTTIRTNIIGGSPHLLPVVPVTCAHCSNTQFYSTNFLGVTGKPQIANQEQQEQVKQKQSEVDPNNNQQNKEAIQ